MPALVNARFLVPVFYALPLVRSVPGTGELHAGLDDVLLARAGLAQRLAGQPEAQPGLFTRGRRRGCGLSPGRSPDSWAPKLPSST
jgi:hypothetical protein